MTSACAYNAAQVGVSTTLSMSPLRTSPRREWGDHFQRVVVCMNRPGDSRQLRRLDGARAATRLQLLGLRMICLKYAQDALDAVTYSRGSYQSANAKHSPREKNTMCD